MLEERFPPPNSDHDREERDWKRAFSPSKKEEYYLAGGNHARSASCRRRYYAVKIFRRRRRSPWALARGNLCCVTGQAGNRTRASSETKRDAPQQCCRRCRTVVKLWNAVTECARLAREMVFARVVVGSKTHSKTRSGRASAGYRHGDPTCTWYRCDSLPGPDAGGTLAIDLNDGDDFSCGCSGGNIGRLGGSICMFVNVVVRHRQPSWPSSGFKQPLAVMKGCLQCLKEWLSS